MLAAVLALSACAVGGHDSPSDRPRRDLAGRPESLAPLPPLSAPPAGRPSGTASSGASRGPGASSGVPSGPAGSTAPAGPGGGPGRSSAPAAFHSVATATDSAHDAGAVTPPYADLRAVTIEDDGTNARVTVRFAGAVPAALPGNETEGVGVDFYRDVTRTESDYQLFADGEPDGWYAYLQTPKGFVKYPGRFGIGGDSLVFTVPWSALGSPRSGRFAAFADWTRSAAAANVSGEDHAPDLATAPFSR